MPRKKKATKRPLKISKSELIRDYKLEHPLSTPTELMLALKKIGVEVTTNYVTTVLARYAEMDADLEGLMSAARALAFAESEAKAIENVRRMAKAMPNIIGSKMRRS